MASIPKISHSINGYSRYDIPENVVFTATPGILYPSRVDFLNAMDVRYIQTGAVVRTDPALVPTFTPYRVQLHRFFCPLQLYHPEMRVNSADFDMRNLSTNLIYTQAFLADIADANISQVPFSQRMARPDSLLAAMSLKCGAMKIFKAYGQPDGPEVTPYPNQDKFANVPYIGDAWVNCDPVLAYYDIIRSYYSFSQLGSFSLAFQSIRLKTNAVGDFANWPGFSREAGVGSYLNGGPGSVVLDNRTVWGTDTVRTPQKYQQAICHLKAIDRFFERSFYPKDDDTVSSRFFNFTAPIYNMIRQSLMGVENPPVATNENLSYSYVYIDGTPLVTGPYAMLHLPYGVLPAMADRFSRTLNPDSTTDVSITSATTVRQLAMAAKAQAYEDLLSGGGSRFSDWLHTFFAAKINHVDRPLLLYSSSFYINSSPIFNQSGNAESGELGSYAGALLGQDTFGKKAQRYCFSEPGYLIDLFSIRPLYYWSGIQKDYARYAQLDYFNPIFNEVGYQDVPAMAYGFMSGRSSAVIAKEPCYNEFRASYDRVFGEVALIPGLKPADQPEKIKSTWVQQRQMDHPQGQLPAGVDTRRYFERLRFVDLNSVNAPFATNTEDHFYVNMYYRVGSKSLVSKNFATNLSSR